VSYEAELYDQARRVGWVCLEHREPRGPLAAWVRSVHTLPDGVEVGRDIEGMILQGFCRRRSFSG
jgi:hypothetical protein